MTLCPVALVAGCKSCPIVKVCPLKTVIGDYKPAPVATEPPAPKEPEVK